MKIVPSEQEDISESETGDSASEASEAIALDPSDKAVISRAAERAKLSSQTASTSTSVFDRGPQRRKSEGLPILPDFISELQSSWKAPSSTSLPRTQLGNLAGAANYGLATAPQIGPTFAMLNGAMARTGRDATHPNKHGRIIDSQLRKAYHASALSARLACTNSLLLVYLEGLLQDLSSTLTEEESVPETLRVVDMLIRGTSAHAQALAQSMANMVQARRQVWLSQANLLDQDSMAVIAAPLVPGEVFGPPAEAALEQSRRTRELTRSVVRAPASRGLRTSAGSSNWARAESSSQAFVGHRRFAAQGAPTRPSQGVRQSFRRTRQAESSSTRGAGGRNRYWRLSTSGPTFFQSTSLPLAPMHSMSMGAEHLGVRIQAPIQIKATPISRDCPYCFERRDAIQVSERRSVSSFRKIVDNTPALGIDRAGVLFNLFPDSKERWGSSAHPESQEVQSSFKASALPYALSFNPFNFHQTRGLVHNSGSPGCLFPHPNSQGPQEVPQVLLSGQRLRVQCSPLRSVIGSPHFHQMYECGTHSSSSPGPTYCQLPGRLGNLLSYRAAGQEQHKGGPNPLAEIGVDSEELSHTHKGSDIPRLEFEFDYNESVSDSTEAVSVEGVPVRVPQKGASYSEVGSETAWPNGGSQSGGAIGVASLAHITAMVSKVQSESIREWTETDSKRPGLSSSSQVVALNSRPEGGSQAGPVMFKGNHNRCLTGRLGCCLARQSSTGKMGCLVDRRTHKPLGAGGSISGLDSFSSSASGEAGDCSFRQHNSRVIHKSPGRCTFSIATQESPGSPVMGTCSRGVPEGCTLAGRGQRSSRPLVKGCPRPGEWRLHPALIQAIWLRFRKAKVDLFATQENTHCPLWYSMVGPRGPLGVDALANKWPPVLLYAFPPFPLLPAVLAKVRILKAKVLLVAPDWPQQSCRI